MDAAGLIADVFQDTLNMYIDGVMDGTITTGRSVRAAVERHVNDLRRQSTRDFPYHFDIGTARKVCNFYPRVLRHSIGRYAGMPFELEPWQIFCEAAIFGWKRDADDTRRFRKSYESVARKNGKSTRAAGRAIYMARYDHNPVAAARQGATYVPEPVSQVVLAATKKEQAEKVVYAEIERMRRASPSIRKGSNDARRQLEFSSNNGSIMCVGSDKPYDGLNPHLVVLDELHAWCEYHRPFYDTMVTGSGFRDQPLISMITTAGDDHSHLWDEVYTFAKNVATGVVQDESFFAYCAELDEDDDPLDPHNWIKANPNLGVSVSEDYLRQQAIEAQSSTVALRRFTRYHGNRKVSSNQRAFSLEQWDACAGALSDWSDADAIGVGVDLGSRDDLAAWSIVARFPMNEEDTSGKLVYRYEVKTCAYIAEDTKRDLAKEPFATWVYEGWLEKCRFPIAELREAVTEACGQHQVFAVAYDPYNAQQLGEDLTAEGITAARMGQSYSMFNEPIRDILKAIEDGRIRHDGNPLLRWCVQNAVLIHDRQDRIMFDKRESSDKIDPVVAMTMAYRMACMAPERATGSLYL